MEATERARWVALLIALALLAAGFLGRALLIPQSLPEGPEPVAWDRVACARCRMLVGDPRFAAQLQTRGGDVLYFDDPGCLLLYAQERAPEIHEVYFHHAHAERWLPREQVAFVPMGPTPMGYGLGAQGRGQPGGLSYEEALARALEREAARRGS